MRLMQSARERRHINIALDALKRREARFMNNKAGRMVENNDRIAMNRLPALIALLFLIAVIFYSAGLIYERVIPEYKLNAGGEDMLGNYTSEIHAPEFPKGFDWINTAPLSMALLRGNVVLLDFWTFCCINCMHVIPDLKHLEEKYAGQPFVVIGVHSAKFDHEEDEANIRNAAMRYGVEHPIVVDKGMAIWTQYGVHSWPTLVLVAPDGRIVRAYSGEGHREALDEAVGELLVAYGREGKLAAAPPQFKPEVFVSPTGLAYPGKVFADDKSKRVFISDTSHHRIVVTDFEGNVLDVAGSGEEGYAEGTFESAMFRRPQGLEIDGDFLYVADTENHAVRRLDLENRTVETIAGTGEQMVWGKGGPSRTTSISSPWDLELIGRDLYIAIAGRHMIWTLDLERERLDIYAGTGREARLDGHRMSAAFAQPSGLAFYIDKLYIADSEISSIRAIDFKSQNVSTVAGGDLFDFGDRDGKGDSVRLQHPLGVAAHGGYIYIADSYNHKIKRLDPVAREVVSFAGTGEAGERNGKADSAQFYEPGGICAAGGKLFVADTNNHKIRVIEIASGLVSTLDIKGLGDYGITSGGREIVYWSPSESRKEYWKDALTVSAEESHSASAEKNEIEIVFVLPDGFHLNEGSRLRLILDFPGRDIAEAALESGFDSADVRNGDGWIELSWDAETAPSRVSIPFGDSASDIADARIRIAASGIICDDAGTICTPFDTRVLSDFKAGLIRLRAESDV